MNWESIPWDKGVGLIFALVLLKMLFDAVYKKIPRGFRSVRNEVRQQTAVFLKQHSEAIDVIKQQGETIARLEDAIETLIGAHSELKRHSDALQSKISKQRAKKPGPKKS